MRVIVIGKSGQLATSLSAVARSQPGVQLILAGRPDLDLEKRETITSQLAVQRPDVVINAAAYTAVDKAETDAERAFAINRDGAAAAARAAAALGVPFVHVSTDYVFDGSKSHPYVEQDQTAPLNVYGRSKLEGEQAVLAEHPTALILRTSWVYSPFGTNFLKTMLRLGAERERLRVVGDQFGNPTSALDLANAILAIAALLPGDPGGIYHLTGQGSTSWHDFASFIFAESGQRGGPCPVVEDITSAEYPTPAVRPKDTRLDCSAFARRFGVQLRPWQEAAAETVARCLSH